MGLAIFGPWARHLFSFLQTVQLILNVGLICLVSPPTFASSAPVG